MAADDRSGRGRSQTHAQGAPGVIIARLQPWGSPLFDSVQGRLARLASEADIQLLHQGRFGLKRACACRRWAVLSLTPHLRALGSALTHPDITTDHSAREALMEFITPPLQSVGAALDYLADVQAYVYRRLDHEILWATSMPCVLAGDKNIPDCALRHIECRAHETSLPGWPRIPLRSGRR